MLGALLHCLVLLAAPPADGDVRVRAVSFRGPPIPDADAVQKLAGALVGAEPTIARLVATLAQLEGLAGTGAFQVIQRPMSAGVEVVFEHDGLPRRVGSVEFVEGEDRAPEAERSWQLRQRLSSGTGGLHLRPGERYHPFLRDTDVEAARRFYVDRGFRDAEIRAEEVQRANLVYVTLRILQGPRDVVNRVTLSGSTLPVVAQLDLVGALETQGGGVEPFSASTVAGDAGRIRARQCALGYPRATVLVKEQIDVATEGTRRLWVDFQVTPDIEVTTGRVQVAGRYVPWSVLAELPLAEGSPFCGDQIGVARRMLAEYLREHGVPDPEVVVSTRDRLDRAGRRRRAVTLRVVSVENVRVERIWFSGNAVTGVTVLRQLMAIREGDLYRQSAVEASVQSLRRSGLFRRVSVRTLPGSAPDKAYLVFTLEERDLIGFDVVAQKLILRNVDVLRWPENLEDVEQGNAFRGAGQLLEIYAQPGRQGTEWAHDFLHRHLLARFNLNRRVSSGGGFDEAWYTVGGGLGVKGNEGRLWALPFAELEWTRTAQTTDLELPVLDGDAFTAALGLEGRFDLNRRDDERIPYFGVNGGARGRAGRSFFGERFSWVDYTADLRGHLPLWTTRRGQHFVLRLRGQISEVVTDANGRLQAHQRFYPTARGYAVRAVGVDFGPSGDPVRLGGLHAGEATAELRIPVPVGRRNAVSPFVDALTAAERAEELLDDPFYAAGLAVSFSFFNERLEGVIWGALPLDDAESSYVGASFGGSF